MVNGKDVWATVKELGYLTLEAKDIFSKVNFRRDQWIPVWSSIPIHRNFTAGIPCRNKNGFRHPHNSIHQSVKLRSVNSFMSLDSDCSQGIDQNSGIV
jgi:hypothetical protein